MTEPAERVVSDWQWSPYTDPGPWDRHLPDVSPTHGWHRVLELDHGEWTYRVTEWHFGWRRPKEPTLLTGTVQAMRLAPPAARAA